MSLIKGQKSIFEQHYEVAVKLAFWKKRKEYNINDLLNITSRGPRKITFIRVAHKGNLKTPYFRSWQLLTHKKNPKCYICSHLLPFRCLWSIDLQLMQNYSAAITETSLLFSLVSTIYRMDFNLMVFLVIAFCSEVELVLSYTKRHNGVYLVIRVLDLFIV